MWGFNYDTGDKAHDKASDKEKSPGKSGSASLLISMGICDSARPESCVTDGVLPIGKQAVPVNSRSIIELRSGLTNVGFFRSTLGELGFDRKSDSGITWMRSFDRNYELSHVYKGQFKYMWKRQSFLLQMTRAGYSSKIGDIFMAPSIATFATESLLPDVDSSKLPQKFWLARTKPSPDYFTHLFKQHIVELRRTTNNTSGKVGVANITNRLHQLLTWLSVEDAGHVLNALLEIARAKHGWAQQAGVLPNKAVSWDDVAPFLVRPRNALPRPGGGEYILGDNLLQLPDYQPQ